VKIILLRAWLGRYEEQTLELADGATLQDALTQSGWEIAAEAVVGVWGKVQSRDRTLRDGDRVEIYRPLTADPKAARRKRAAR